MTADEQSATFDGWLRDHRGILIKIARTFVDKPTDFDDLLQEILIQVWRSVPAFHHRSRVSTWIYRVALNRALLWQRQETRRRNQEINVEQLPPPLPANRAPVEQLYEAIRRLRKPDRALILLSLEGLSYREIAAIAELSESNVGVRLSRIRQKLHTLITTAQNHG